MMRTQTGTPYYASPEVWKDQPYDKRSDIWSIGCVLYEMITLNPPFKASDMNGLYKRIIAGKYTPIPSTYSKDLADVVKSCLNTIPRCRPTCTEILAMTQTENNLGETLKGLDVVLDQPGGGLLGTIKLPRGQHISSISSRLPKANYGMARNSSEGCLREGPTGGLPNISNK
jgi:NIMA (never in mitosis gene a)-related kinase